MTAIQAAGFPLTLPNRAKGRTAKTITRVMLASYNRLALMTFCQCAVNWVFAVILNY